MKQAHFEKFMIVFATVEPIATIPQILQIWVGHNTSGVSLLTWLFYTLTSFVWLMYGAMKKDKPLIVSGMLWVLSQSLVVISVLVR
jgi:uncharacterized protein with PQ loop repeat